MRKANKLQSLTHTYRFYIFIFSIVFALYSCGNSHSEDFEIINTSSPFDFNCIETHEGIVYASGGNVWTKSLLSISSDGTNWTTDSLTNKSIFDLYSDGETLYAVGNDGYIFYSQPDLILSRTKFWGLLRGFTASEEGFVAVGGKDFNKGWIYKVNTELQVDTAQFFENEIHDVKCTESGRCIACGYGVILTSEDSGLSWQRSDVNGDFYGSVGINSDGILYIVGYSGSIIYSRDEGISWNKLKNGNSPLTNNKPFRTIKFQNDTGVIVGDNGLIWISYNNGNDWTDASIETDLDLFDFVFFQNDLLCISEAGQIIKVPL